MNKKSDIPEYNPATDESKSDTQHAIDYVVELAKYTNPDKFKKDIFADYVPKCWHIFELVKGFQHDYDVCKLCGAKEPHDPNRNEQDTSGFWSFKP